MTIANSTPEVYQMTRGALVLFVGIFSVLFLKRHLRPFQWFALFVVVLGVGIVGLAGALFKEPAPIKIQETTAASAAVRTIIGVLLIAGAQIFTATQFVVEEWILENYALEPLKVVGWEGIFGFVVTVIGMIFLHLTIGRHPEGQYGYFDAVEGLKEITSYRAVAVSSLAIMVSIGGFNFFGISVTRSISATARSVIDTCRTLFIWVFSLALHWESFKPLQIVGFALLVYGTFLFNGTNPSHSLFLFVALENPLTHDTELIRPPMAACLGKRKGVEYDGINDPEQRTELLHEHPIEHN